jgi:Transposase
MPARDREATLYKWKAKYGGMEVADAKRLRGLEDENRRLKKLLAEAKLDNAALKDILGKPSEACRATSSGDAALPGAWAQPTARLQAGGDRSFHVALSSPARGRSTDPSALT